MNARPPRLVKTILIRLTVTVLSLQDLRDLGSQSRHLVHDDIPHDVIIHTEVAVYHSDLSSQPLLANRCRDNAA